MDDVFGIVGVWSSIAPSQDLGINRPRFMPYNRQLRGTLKRDNIPFATLFWLSAGCLPVVPGCVYDLCYDQEREYYHTSLPEDFSLDLFTSNGAIEPPRRRSVHERRARSKEPRNSGDGNSGDGNRRSGSIEANKKKGYENQHDKTRSTREEVIAGRHSDTTVDQSAANKTNFTLLRYVPIGQILVSSYWHRWAKAAGCDLQNIKLLEIYQPELDSEEFLRSLEEFIASPLASDKNTTGLWVHIETIKMNVDSHRTAPHPGTYIWRSDIYNLCLGLLSLPITRRHFLFNRGRSRFGYDIVTAPSATRRRLFTAISTTIPDCSTRLDNLYVRRLMKLSLPKIDHPSKNSSGLLSDYLTRLDGCICKLQPPIRLFYRQSIAILYLSTPRFRWYLDAFMSPREDQKQTLFKECYVLIDVPANTVRTYLADGAGGLETTDYRLAFFEVFSEASVPPSALIEGFKVRLDSVMLSCLQAWVKSAWML